MGEMQTWRDMLTQGEVRSIADVQSYVSLALQLQYSASRKLMGFGRIFQDEVDATDDLQTLFDEAFSLDNAEGVFLDWWGERIGVSRTIEIDGKAVTLDDITYKTILRWRQVANISRSDAKTLNDLFSKLLNIPIAVTDKGTMALEIAIDNEIDSSSLFVLRFFLVALKPAGVGINLTIDYASMFGFNGQKLSTFNFGVFNTNSLG